jgi:hypothetical protein
MLIQSMLQVNAYESQHAHVAEHPHADKTFFPAGTDGVRSATQVRAVDSVQNLGQFRGPASGR